MVALLHEIWVEPDENGSELTSCCLAGPHGDDFRRTLSPAAKLIGTFVAGSHYDAMTVYYSRMGWGAYTTDQPWDLQPYPAEWA